MSPSVPANYGHIECSIGLCYDDIPEDVNVLTLPDTINSDWLDNRGK